MGVKECSGWQPLGCWECCDAACAVPPPVRLAITACSDIYFVGGFGTVSWIDVKEYMSAKPDIIAADNTEVTLQVRGGRRGEGGGAGEERVMARPRSLKQCMEAQIG